MIDMTHRVEIEELVFDTVDDGCGGFKAFYDSMVEKGYMRYNEKDGIYEVVDIRGINKCLFGGEITTGEETRDELTEFILNMLPSSGYVTRDSIVHDWLDVAAIRIDVRLEELEAEGKIRSDLGGTRWKLRNRPVVVTELPGDPNLRRGGT